MAERVLPAVSLGIAPFNGIGDGHAHGEEEHGVDDVRKAHAVLHRFEMFHPVRNIQDGPEIVDKDHQGHGETPKNVNR